MNLHSVLLVSAIILVPGSALAAERSNLGAGGYPEHDCGTKPGKPVRPESFTENAQIETYNAEVDRYNRATREYIDCVQRYVDNASEDIGLIKSMMKTAIDEANKP